MAKVYKGIDVSFYQGDVDFAAARDDGISFVMLKASQGRTSDYNEPFEDPKFRTNTDRLARTPGQIYGGSYHYLMARNTDEAVREAKFFISAVEPYRYNLQLWSAVDVEDASLPEYGALTECVGVFCRTLSDAGLRPMVYSSAWWLKNRFRVPANVPVWEAAWSASSFPDGARMWQRGAGSVAGISGAVDVNYAYAIMGDANGDGAVNAKDVTATMRHILGKSGGVFNESQMDFDRNGVVNARDVTALMREIL